MTDQCATCYGQIRMVNTVVLFQQNLKIHTATGLGKFSNNTPCYLCIFVFSYESSLFFCCFFVKIFLLNILVHFSYIETQGWNVSPRGAGFLFGSDAVQKVCCIVC